MSTRALDTCDHVLLRAPPAGTEEERPGPRHLPPRSVWVEGNSGGFHFPAVMDEAASRDRAAWLPSVWVSSGVVLFAVSPAETTDVAS